MQGFKSVRIYLKGNEQGNRYTLSDINMPFFLPVYFEDASLSDIRSIENIEAMYRILCKKELKNNLYNNVILHEVGAGETLYSIAKYYEVSQEEILKYNPILKNSPLQIGQLLTINLNEDNIIKRQDTPQKTGNTLPEISEKESTNIVVYLLLDMSVLLNGLFLWEFLDTKSKKLR